MENIYIVISIFKEIKNVFFQQKTHTVLLSPLIYKNSATLGKKKLSLHFIIIKLIFIHTRTHRLMDFLVTGDHNIQFFFFFSFKLSFKLSMPLIRSRDKVKLTFPRRRLQYLHIIFFKYKCESEKLKLINITGGRIE